MSTNSSSSSGQNQLQKTFIAMIFAFVISYHAQTITEFIAVITNNWTTFPISNKITYDFLAVTTQIILALLMVSISWVMWSKSSAKAHLDDIERIFSVKFITFIIEILLVTLYFGLIKSLEVDFSEFSKTKDMSKYITDLSAKPEAFLMTLVFFIFFIWDFINDIWKSPTDPKPTGLWNRFKCMIQGLITYCSISLLCFVSALTILWINPLKATAFITIYSDLALICLLLLFNQAKVLEYYPLQWFSEQKTRFNTMRMTPPTKWEIAKIITIFVFGLISSVIVFVMVKLCIPQ